MTCVGKKNPGLDFSWREEVRERTRKTPSRTRSASHPPRHFVNSVSPTTPVIHLRSSDDLETGQYERDWIANGIDNASPRFLSQELSQRWHCLGGKLSTIEVLSNLIRKA